MKKSIIFLLLMITAIAGSVTAVACWASPEPFEIISKDGNKVFIFEPVEETFLSNANAAVYEIVNNERQLIYTINGLNSFSYENSFYFSDDMMHFIRIFPESGSDAFEVFSNGIKTSVIKRRDFIFDHSSIRAETSIGPDYTVRWNVEEGSLNDNIISISTSEEKTLLFDIAAAEFIYETGNRLPEAGSNPVSETRSLVIEIIVGSILILAVACIFIFIKFKR